MYNSTGKWEFVGGQRPFDSVQVRARRTAGSPGGPVPLFFGRTLGSDVADSSAGAVATFLPRDIGDGIRRGRESLSGSYARPGAKKVMIVLTDGLANQPGTDAYARHQLGA